MKKIDRLILGAFIGPFILTTAVVVFILLIQQLMQHLDDLLGKGVSYWVFAELCFYFAMHIVPLALPLAVLLSSLITFGNLGEHMELTALKGAGISLIRVLAPIFLFTVMVSIGSFWFNDKVVPVANLEAYRLLWDIKQKSPSLSIKEGSFYNGLPGYSIKINHKFPDGKSIKDVMIYDHTDKRGNTKLILADSGRMYTIRNDRYLVLELFTGKSYHDKVAMQDGSFSNQKFLRSNFDKSQVIFSLSSFDMQSTDKRLFQQHRYMRSAKQLSLDIDSMQQYLEKNRSEALKNILPNYRYHLREASTQTQEIDPNFRNRIQTSREDTMLVKVVKLGKSDEPKTEKKATQQPVKMVKDLSETVLTTRALAQARSLASLTQSYATNINTQARQTREFAVEFYKKFTLAFACISMFLIGAPLGAIIKKGGLGVPVLVSIIFFILFYVISISGEKWVKEDFVHVMIGMSAANIVLLSFGFLFLRQARNDSRLFEVDFYSVWWDKIKKHYRKNEAR